MLSDLEHLAYLLLDDQNGHTRSAVDFLYMSQSVSYKRWCEAKGGFVQQ